MLKQGILVTLLIAASAGAQTTPQFTPSQPLGPVVAAREGADEVLSLSQCVLRALTANDKLLGERQRMRELEGQMDQALSTGLPTLDLVGDWSRSRDPSFALDSTFGGGGGGFGTVPGADPWFNDWLAGFGSLIPPPEEIPAQTYWRTNLNLNWTINPVKIMGAVGAARLGIDRQELALRSVELETADRTVAAYHAVIRSAERVRAVEAEMANQSELLDIVRLRFELGLATQLDTLQAAVGLANLTPQLTVARTGLRNQGSRLNALMGRRPEEPLAIANEQLVELDRLNDETALHLAQQRPELAATDMFVDILRRNRQAQVADARPYLTVFGQYGYVGRTADSVFDNGHDTWRASVAVNIPVFNGFLTRGLVTETDGRIRRTESELTGMRRDVQVEALNLLANVRAAREVLAAAELNQQRSEEVLDESLLQLELGKVGYLDVLVAESNRAAARRNVIDARYELLAATSALKRALGQDPLQPLAAVPGLVAEVRP